MEDGSEGRRRMEPMTLLQKLGQHYVLSGALSFFCVVLALMFLLLMFDIQDTYVGSEGFASHNEVLKEYARAVKADVVRDLFSDLSAVPKLPYVQRSRALADLVKARWDDLGFETMVETRPVLLSMPQTDPSSRQVVLLDGSRELFRASLTEPVEPSVAAPFIAFSGDGEATGALVYVGLGRAQDFAAVQSKGVSFSQKVVLVRAGGRYLPSIVHQAQSLGAVAVLVYSDPIDAGSSKGPAYPDGPWRPDGAMTRDQAWLGLGDPTTPLFPSSQKAPTLPKALLQGNASYGGRPVNPLPRIPVQPLSANDAAPLLASLNGTIPAPDVSFLGGLAAQYSVGPSGGARKVHVRVVHDTYMANITNVFARIGGAMEPDRVVILGSHRDAFTTGTVESISSTATLLAVSKGYAVALKAGWQPGRSILLASWDASELALAGSTEWVEANRPWLMSQAVAYVNIDVGVSGGDRFVVDASPQLRSIVREVMDEVGVLQDDGSYAPLTGYHDGHFDLPDLLSDAFPFAQFAGVPVADLSFRGAYDSAVLKTYIDGPDWMERFADPEYNLHVALSQTLGSLGLHLADRIMLPLNYSNYVGFLDDAMPDLVTMAASAGSESSVANALARLRTTIDYFRDVSENLAAAQSAMEALLLRYAGEAYISPDGNYLSRSSLPSVVVLPVRALNNRLVNCERVFAGRESVLGIYPGHILYSAALEDWNHMNALPTVRNALYSKNTDAALFEISLVDEILRTAAAVLNGEALNH